jgi:GntR family transcriptional regulator
MKFARKANKPRYLNVADNLRDGIRSRKWIPGDLLPSETQLCKQFGVSRGTVVKAIDVLLSEGLLQRRQGVGTFVARPALHRMPGYLLGFSETVRRQGRTPTHRVISESELSRADALQFGCDEPAFMFKRIRLVDDVPWAIHNALIPSAVAANLPSVYGPASRVKDATFSLYDAFDDAGVIIDHADESINVRLATEDESDLLMIKRPSAVMLVHRKSFDPRGQLVELIEAVYLEGCYTYDTRLVRAQGVAGFTDALNDSQPEAR